MQVTTGFSREHTDGKWSKMDVTVEEVDFQRFLAERGIDPSTHMRPAVVWTLMSAEADSFLIVRQVNEGLITEADARAQIARIRATQDKIISGLKGDVE